MDKKLQISYKLKAFKYSSTNFKILEDKGLRQIKYQNVQDQIHLSVGERVCGGHQSVYGESNLNQDIANSTHIQD